MKTLYTSSLHAHMHSVDTLLFSALRCLYGANWKVCITVGSVLTHPCTVWIRAIVMGWCICVCVVPYWVWPAGVLPISPICPILPAWRKMNETLIVKKAEQSVIWETVYFRERWWGKGDKTKKSNWMTEWRKWENGLPGIVCPSVCIVKVCVPFSYPSSVSVCVCVWMNV